jgi:hypothetical protein
MLYQSDGWKDTADMTVNRYENGEPIPDGYHMLNLKRDIGEAVSEQAIVRLEMKHYRFFRHEDRWFVAASKLGHIERYNNDNILYIEMHPNSDEVVKALIEWRGAQDNPPEHVHPYCGMRHN